MGTKRHRDCSIDGRAALRVLGLIARKNGEHDYAVRFGRSALDVAINVQNRWMTAKAREELGESLVAAGQPSEARVEYAAAAEAYGEMGAHARADRLYRHLDGPSGESHSL